MGRLRRDHDLHAAQRVPRRAGGGRAVPQHARLARRHLRASSDRGPRFPCGHRQGATQRRPPLSVNHNGQFPSVTIAFNLAGDASLGQAVDAIDAGRGRHAPAPERPRRLPGHRAGLHVVAQERAAARPRGAPHRLHRARRALRELRAPDHDPLDAALGRHRRTGGPHALRRRPERHRHHRAAAPHRDREEERHPPHRLRDRGRARRGRHRRRTPSCERARFAFAPS